MRGHPLEQGRGGRVGADAIGHVGAEISCRQGVFGVGAVGLGSDHPIADAQRRYLVADGLDGAAHLIAEDEGHLPWVEPRAEVRVEEVHAYRLGFDQYLTGPGVGCGFST